MLNLVLRANAASCAIFGGLFALNGPAIAALIGSPPVLFLQFLGVGLMINAALLVATSLRAKPDRRIILTFAFGDAIWVVASVIFLACGLWVTTASGIIWTIGVATFVGICGVLQWKLAP